MIKNYLQLLTFLINKNIILKEYNIKLKYFLTIKTYFIL